CRRGSPPRDEPANRLDGVGLTPVELADHPVAHTPFRVEDKGGRKEPASSAAVTTYVKLSGLRLSRRPRAVSACGYMRNPSVPPWVAPGKATSWAALNATQLPSQPPKSLGRTASTSGWSIFSHSAVSSRAT